MRGNNKRKTLWAAHVPTHPQSLTLRKRRRRTQAIATCTLPTSLLYIHQKKLLLFNCGFRTNMKKARSPYETNVSTAQQLGFLGEVEVQSGDPTSFFFSYISKTTLCFLHVLCSASNFSGHAGAFCGACAAGGECASSSTSSGTSKYSFCTDFHPSHRLRRQRGQAQPMRQSSDRNRSNTRRPRRGFPR